MLKQLSIRAFDIPRSFHSSAYASVAAIKQQHQPPCVTQIGTQQLQEKKNLGVQHVKRNELGVQLLSRKLHAQLFSNVVFPRPDPSYVRIAREHLEMHGLDPTEASVLPDTAFTLPPLQGATIAEHFHRIGTHAAHPWLALATSFASASLPPKPEQWDTQQSGWTKYHYRPDGSSFSEHVPYPADEDDTLVFDVETMPNYHPYAVLACAASRTSWYAWISPWLLGESEDPQQLIPFGSTVRPRVVVGHNVSYDRARVREEYALARTGTRFVDTMALHVAVRGISSHQRPAWMRHRRTQQKAQERRDEVVEVVEGLLRDVKRRQTSEEDTARREELRRIRLEMEESLPQLQADVDSVEAEAKRWEDLTSANSLADVARLHCGITMDKEVRDDFMTHTPTEIVENLHDYINYCATDVHVTHTVFARVLPAFLDACPSPVSFAGVLAMGSSFLPVNETWEAYLVEAERVYKELEAKVKTRLVELTESARTMMNGGEWKDDVWLGQLDWTPKVASASRGVYPLDEVPATTEPDPGQASQQQFPTWYLQLLTGPLEKYTIERILPLLLNLSFDRHPLQYTITEKWHISPNGIVSRPPSAGKTKTTRLLGPTHGLPYLKNGRMGANDVPLAMALCSGDLSGDTIERVLNLATHTLENTDSAHIADDPWLRQLDWSPLTSLKRGKSTRTKEDTKKPLKPLPVLWPKWYWDLTKPKKGLPPGTLDVTVRNRIAPLLLRLSWLGWPLFHSREHGWVFRVPTNNGASASPTTITKSTATTRSPPLEFHDPADDVLQEATLRGGFVFHKLPHKDGESANVGNPLGKAFIPYALDGTLRSPGDEAREALEMSAQCSYWIGARDRISKQLVVWQDQARGIDVGFRAADNGTGKWGMILPQVITMGTVTRRAIEKTWLTASNAKANRVGSELKAMVRAPPGYSIVGADVDSEELWISSCMGDAQFGMHGATALGWMTLEGTKAAGTDLHSKTAAILRISRDQAKVFNYARIYGAGMRHAILLLLQSNAAMLPEEAQKLAENLYASTKGRNTHRADMFGRKFWYGGTESFVFNKLEEIALSDRPQTPALGCGVTYALSKEYLPAEFGADYMPSRINWVVQSSGVDYLHLLIVAMEHLIAKYAIDARYLISVHDELRYLVAESDRYRAALALQVANLWTRSMFAYKLGMDDLPQGVAFFSAVDVDHVLRKEVDMPCVTPSQRVPIPPGESLDIEQVLSKTGGGSLWKDGRPMGEDAGWDREGTLEGYREPDCLLHRAQSAAFLRAQATTELGEVKYLAQQVSGKGGAGGGAGRGGGRKGGTMTHGKARKRKAPIGNGDDMNWGEAVEEMLGSLVEDSDVTVF